MFIASEQYVYRSRWEQDVFSPYQIRGVNAIKAFPGTEEGTINT